MFNTTADMLRSRHVAARFDFFHRDVSGVSRDRSGLLDGSCSRQPARRRCGGRLVCVFWLPRNTSK